MTWLLIIFVIFFIIIIFCFLESKRECSFFQTTEYKVSSPKLKGMSESIRAVFLSDLHNYSYGEDNEDLLRAIQDANPNFIFIGGDMLVRRNGTSYEETLRFLKRLPEICPVYYANGNHEQKLKLEPEYFEQSYKEYRNTLISFGIRMLENESISLNFNGVAVTLTGLEIPLKGYRKFYHCKLDMSDIETCIGTSSDNYQILLAHHPGHVPLYKEWGADLILSGHLHGGVMRLPILGGVIAPDFRLFPKYSGGIYHEKDATVVVSKGLGVHSVAIRIFNPAEMIILDFQP